MHTTSRFCIGLLASVGVATLPLPASAQLLGAGAGHTCAVLPSGALACWGWNEQGQAGDGTGSYNTSGLPVLASGVAGATAVDGGYQHSCAVVAAGAVQCWGYNLSGQIGIAGASSVPVNVAGLNGPALTVATGGAHSCASLGANGVWCWGDGQHGQHGNGVFTAGASPTPVQTTGVTGASSLTAGGEHSCAVVTGGTVKCWGRNHVGQLGSGFVTADPGVHTAVDVANVSGALAVVAGYSHTCALVTGGSVRCWGSGNRGQLGNNDTANSPGAVSVNGISTTTALAAGDYHTCALLQSGNVACWGYNYWGTLGDGSNRNDSLIPVGVVGVANATAIAASSEHTCARVSQPAVDVKCWGHGQFGQLGDGRFGGAHEVPYPVFVLKEFDFIFGSRQSGSFEF